MAALIRNLTIRGARALPHAETSTPPATTQIVDASSSPRFDDDNQQQVPAASHSAIAQVSETDPVQVLENELRRSKDEHEMWLKKERETHQLKCDALEKDAKTRGYGEGLAQGKQSGQEKYVQAAARLDALIGQANASLANKIDEANDLIGAIVFEACTQIVGKALMTPEGNQAVVAEIIARTKREDIVTVKVSPRDLQLITAMEEHGLGDIRLEADEAIELGGCIVYLKGGRLDGRIETQFRLLAQSLKTARNQ